MAEVSFKTLPRMGTWLFAALVPASALWFAILRDGWGLAVSVLVQIGALVWVLVSLYIMVFRRSRRSVLEFLIACAALLSCIPALKVGASVRERIFLANIDYYQNAIDRLASRDKETLSGTWSEYLPDFSSCLVKEHIIVDKGYAGVLTVMFDTRDSSALGHAGLLYRSDDDAKGLHDDHPEIGFKRIAPKWYEWRD